MVVYPGSHIHQTPIGDLHLDTELADGDLRLVSDEMIRRGLMPDDIRWANINGTDIDFGLREPLSNE